MKIFGYRVSGFCCLMRYIQKNKLHTFCISLGLPYVGIISGNSVEDVVAILRGSYFHAANEYTQTPVRPDKINARVVVQRDRELLPAFAAFDDMELSLLGTCDHFVFKE